MKLPKKCYYVFPSACLRLRTFHRPNLEHITNYYTADLQLPVASERPGLLSRVRLQMVHFRL